MIPLRDYQRQLKAEIIALWLLHRYVLAVSATGSGKTVLFSDIVASEPNASCVIAHRHELVSQISLALARNGVRHKIVGSPQLAKECTAAHMEELGVNYVDPNSRVAAASVDTLIRMDPNDTWFASVKLWVMDEAHHLLQHNKWGKAVAMFPNARGLGVTAETERADGYGLGAMNDGIFQAIVLAPDMREIINRGYLTDYRVFCPPSDLDLSTVDVGPSGEFVPAKLSKATKASHITGDVVKHYMRIAPGKLGICFAVDIESAGDIAAGFRDAGIAAEVVSSKTPAKQRRRILRDFRDRKILMLVNVDLFGEGFDLPAIEVVIMARATASFNLYKQQFGRALRLMPGKEWAIIIDHVGNVIRHGLPDQIKLQTLGRPVPKSKREADENLIPMTTCAECTRPYERTYPKCKWCGHGRVPASRSAPEFVEGDLLELTQEVLAKMRGEADRITGPCPVTAVDAISGNMVKMHNARAAAQNRLRETMGLWMAWQQHQGRDEHFIYRLFYLTYGVDVGTAQTLGVNEATELRDRLQKKLDAVNVVAIV